MKLRCLCSLVGVVLLAGACVGGSGGLVVDGGSAGDDVFEGGPVAGELPVGELVAVGRLSGGAAGGGGEASATWAQADLPPTARF